MDENSDEIDFELLIDSVENPGNMNCVDITEKRQMEVTSEIVEIESTAGEMSHDNEQVEIIQVRLIDEESPVHERSHMEPVSIFPDKMKENGIVKRLEKPSESRDERKEILVSDLTGDQTLLTMENGHSEHNVGPSFQNVKFLSNVVDLTNENDATEIGGENIQEEPQEEDEDLCQSEEVTCEDSEEGGQLTEDILIEIEEEVESDSLKYTEDKEEGNMENAEDTSEAGSMKNAEEVLKTAEDTRDLGHMENPKDTCEDDTCNMENLEGTHEAGNRENPENTNEAENTENLEDTNDSRHIGNPEGTQEAGNVENLENTASSPNTEIPENTIEPRHIASHEGTHAENTENAENTNDSRHLENLEDAHVAGNVENLISNEAEMSEISGKTLTNTTSTEINNSTETLTYQINSDSERNGPRPKKRGRPKKSKTVPKTVEISKEPVVKRRRTNNSLSNMFDEGGDINMECFALENRDLGPEVCEMDKETEKVPTKHQNVKLKTLRVALTPIDVGKYKQCSVKVKDKCKEICGKRKKKVMKTLPRVVLKSTAEEPKKRGRPRKHFPKKKVTKPAKKLPTLKATLKPKLMEDYVLEEEKKNGELVKLFKCKHCDYTTNLKVAIIRHYIQHGVPSKQCRFCDFQTRCTQKFLEHEAKHTNDRPFKCNQCEYRCKYRRDLGNHKYKHLKEKKYRCPHEGCSFITKWKKNINHHLDGHRTDRPFACHLCKMTFKRKQTLKYHLYRHNDVKPKQCEICDFRCKTNYELKMHKLKHSDVRPYPCTFPGCTQRCKVKSDLVKHLLIHSKVKNYLCPLCGRGFKSQTELNKHNRRHSDVRPFSCDLCDKSFKFMGSLRQHLKNHQGIKPFECEICGHLFSNKSNKDHHMVTHDYNNRPFRCPICPYGAKSKDNLLAHIGTMHGQTYAFFCELCKKPFKRYAQLRVHHSRMHSKEEFNRYMNSIGINLEDIQKEVKVEMVDQGLISREEIGQMQVSLREDDGTDEDDVEDEDEDDGSEAVRTEERSESGTERSESGTNSKERTQSPAHQEAPEGASNESAEVNNAQASKGKEGSNEVETGREHNSSGKTKNGKESNSNSSGKSSNNADDTARNVRIKQEPRDNFSVSATLAIYDDFRLPLFTRGFEFNIDKSGKKPRTWFMEMDNMPSEAKWHQQRYFNRLGGYEAKRAREAERKRVFEETGEDIKVDLRRIKGRKRKRISYQEVDSDEDELEMVEEKRRGRPPKEVSANDESTMVKKRRGRPPKVKPAESPKELQSATKDKGKPKAQTESTTGQENVTAKRRGRPPKKKEGNSDRSPTNCVQNKAGAKKTQKSQKLKGKKVQKTLPKGKVKQKGSLKGKPKGKKVTVRGMRAKKGKSVKSKKKVAPLKLKLKQNKRSKWVCSQVDEGAKKTKPGAKKNTTKGKRGRKSKKQKENFVIDWESGSQSMDESANEMLSDANTADVKLEIPEEKIELGNHEGGDQGHVMSSSDRGQGHEVGPSQEGQGHQETASDGREEHSAPSMHSGPSGQGDTQPVATFYSDDVILLKRSRQGHGVIQRPAQERTTNIGEDGSTARLPTNPPIRYERRSNHSAINSINCELGQKKDFILGMENVQVYRNPEVSEMNLSLINCSEDETAEVHSEIDKAPVKVEPIA